MYTVGFVVNPLAGLGGPVGLKGTDGCADEAVARGAVPKSGERAGTTLQHLSGADIRFLTSAGTMGADLLQKAGFPDVTIVHQPGSPTTAADTREACKAFRKHAVDCILFCGGDGTARDVCSAVGTRVPVLGIPAGVKMYSGVFALGPVEAANVIRSFSHENCVDAEVMDIDEGEYRKGHLIPGLFGVVRTPRDRVFLQLPKGFSDDSGDPLMRTEIARFIVSLMVPGSLWLLGPGSTTGEVSTLLGIRKTLLGIDAVADGALVGEDLSEQGILSLIDRYERVKVVVSPLGLQGFVLGRGNQPLSAEVIRRVGPENVIIIATPAKCRDTPVLYLDCGDPELNARFSDPVRVICGYALAMRKPLCRVG